MRSMADERRELRGGLEVGRIKVALLMSVPHSAGSCGFELPVMAQNTGGLRVALFRLGVPLSAQILDPTFAAGPCDSHVDASCAKASFAMTTTIPTDTITIL